MDFEQLQRLQNEWEQDLSSTTPPINQVQHQVNRRRQKRIAGRSSAAVVSVLAVVGIAVSLQGADTESIEAAEPSTQTTGVGNVLPTTPPDIEAPPQDIPAPCDVYDPDVAALFTEHVRYLPLDGVAEPATEIIDDQLVVTAQVDGTEVTLKWPVKDPVEPSNPGQYVFAEKFGDDEYIYVVPSDDVSFPIASDVAAALDGNIETTPPDPNSNLLRPQVVIDSESLIRQLEGFDQTCKTVGISTAVEGREIGPLTHTIGETLFGSSGDVPETGQLVVDSVVSSAIPTEVLSCDDPGADKIEENLDPVFFPDPQLALSEFVRPKFGEESAWGATGYTEMKASDDLIAYVVPLEGSVPSSEYVRVIVIEQFAEGWTVTSAKGTGC